MVLEVPAWLFMSPDFGIWVWVFEASRNWTAVPGLHFGYLFFDPHSHGQVFWKSKTPKGQILVWMDKILLGTTKETLQ